MQNGRHTLTLYNLLMSTHVKINELVIPINVFGCH